MKKDILILLVIIGSFALLQTLNFVNTPERKNSPYLLQTNDQNYVNTITKAGDWAMLEFWMPGCPACIRIKPHVNQLASEMVGQLSILTVNLNEAPAISGQFQVNATPTLILLYRGREVSRKMGYMSENELQDWIFTYLEETPDLTS